ncbi:MAG: non-hydrolyzing UDP-N-acetylglucosamine 2-epimerase [Candidatus Baldrarchaeia archaeon]
MSEITIVVGTRPETIKMAPVIREFEEKGINFVFIHTGQHYDYNMSRQFIAELGLPEPDYSFELENHKPAAQIGEMMVKLEKSLSKIDTKMLLIQGDTNTMLAAALTGVKLGLKVGHIEAGLRSYDWRMPEEHNRRMVDHVSDILFAPTERAKKNLEDEHVHGKIYVTGNTVIDAVAQYLPLAETKSNITDEIKFDVEDYALVTVHRAENVDDPKVLKNFVEAFLESPIPLVFPVHPRTLKRLREFNLYHKLTSSKNIQLLPPIGYFDFLKLMKNCMFILTDSGGIQEEATSPLVRKPVLVLRTSTERPEAVKGGFAKVVGTKRNIIIGEIQKILDNPPKLPKQSPFGDGKAAQHIIEIVSEYLKE